MKRTPYFMRGVLQGVGGFEIKNYRSFFILSPSILSAFPYHYPSYEVTYYSWGFKYHITNKGKNKPFPKVGQGLLNGRLLQSATVDRTVHCSRPYGPLQRIIQSAAGDCSNPTDRRA